MKKNTLINPVIWNHCNPSDCFKGIDDLAGSVFGYHKGLRTQKIRCWQSALRESFREYLNENTKFLKQYKNKSGDIQPPIWEDDISEWEENFLNRYLIRVDLSFAREWKRKKWIEQHFIEYGLFNYIALFSAYQRTDEHLFSLIQEDQYGRNLKRTEVFFKDITQVSGWRSRVKFVPKLRRRG